ncbi:endonuclease/exonuclease/phosphatase family domain-containing protein 1 [Anabrus simplex]|uniref:endonuclease/exonuclease/phosphatase family domain-containing protein 1 n=1 Tax=Anabrus simplex TaxID=316456 RepID=UPI0035A35D50
MGQNASTPLGTRVGGHRKSLRDSWRSPFPRRSQTHQGALSATFHFIDDDKHIEQLNVNTASEEELMTLPGITRSIAQNIVEYRLTIGGFKKVEDLALVSGIGAEKLDLIRPEICVGRRKNASCASSRAQSYDSLPSTDTQYSRLGVKSSPSLYNRVVNVNTATVFELMAVHGLNQELAANVVAHRERRGPFRTIEDLLKVKGINQIRLGALRAQLTLESPQEDTGSMKNGFMTPAVSVSNSIQIPNGKIPGAGHRKTHSGSTKYSNLSNGFLAVNDIFELLSASSQRPIIEEDFHYERNGKSAIRVSTWNLHKLDAEKIENPGVREIFCQTILENKLSLIAVQEVLDTVALQKLCDELNHPTLRRVADWSENSREWKFSLPGPFSSTKGATGLGFLYDSSCQVQLMSMRQLCIPDGSCNVGAVLSNFKVGNLSLSLLNMYLQDNDIESIRSVEKLVQGQLKPTDMLIILGDFTGGSQNEELNEIQRLQYQNIAPSSSSTNSTDREKVRFADNIFLNAETQIQFTGVWGIIRQGLTHLAIPRGWMWGGAASEHCPVWCELYTEPVLAEKTAAAV